MSQFINLFVNISKLSHTYVIFKDPSGNKGFLAVSVSINTCDFNCVQMGRTLDDVFL